MIYGISNESKSIFFIFSASAHREPPFNFKVFTTEGGVKFIVLKEGEGPLARDGDFLVVDFTG